MFILSENDYEEEFLSSIINHPIYEMKKNCEIYTIRFPGYDNFFRLPDMSEDVYKKFLLDSEISDESYQTYKRQNNMVEITDFNGEATKELFLLLEDGFRQRRIVFKAIYDSAWEEKNVF